MICIKTIKVRIKIANWLYEWIVQESGTNQGGPLRPNIFRELLCNMRNFLQLHHSIIINDDDILVHMSKAHLTITKLTQTCSLGIIFNKHFTNE